jgi:hypothetical protein
LNSEKKWRSDELKIANMGLEQSISYRFRDAATGEVITGRCDESTWLRLRKLVKRFGVRRVTQHIPAIECSGSLLDTLVREAEAALEREEGISRIPPTPSPYERFVVALPFLVVGGLTMCAVLNKRHPA